MPPRGLLVVALALVAGGCGGVARAPAPHPPRGGHHDASCAAAAVRDPTRPRCAARAGAPPDRAVTPSPAVARSIPNIPCRTLVARPDFDVCAFGTPADRAVATVALVGDSH